MYQNEDNKDCYVEEIRPMDRGATKREMKQPRLEKINDMILKLVDNSYLITATTENMMDQIVGHEDDEKSCDKNTPAKEPNGMIEEIERNLSELESALSRQERQTMRLKEIL